MNAIKDGGPAFPIVAEDNIDTVFERGMTLRDYFAAKAMQGDFAAGPDVSFDAFFKRAPSYYRMADAMLAAREGKP